MAAASAPGLELVGPEPVRTELVGPEPVGTELVGTEPVRTELVGTAGCAAPAVDRCRWIDAGGWVPVVIPRWQAVAGSRRAAARADRDRIHRGRERR